MVYSLELGEHQLNTPNIKQIRKRLKLTQQQLAQLLGVHSMTVSRWERGSASPNHYQVQQLRLLDEGTDTLSEDGRQQFHSLLAMGLFVGALAIVIAAATTLKNRLDQS